MGDKVNLTVNRDGKTIDLTAFLTKRPVTEIDNSQSNYSFNQLLPQLQNPDNNENNNNNDLFSNLPNFP